MSSWLPHLRNISAGVFIGVFIGMAYFMIIESDLSDEYTKYWVYGVSALVTLFASGVALAGVLANLETAGMSGNASSKPVKRCYLRFFLNCPGVASIML